MWGVAKPQGKPAAEIATWEDLKEVWGQPGTVVWVDIEDATEEALKRLNAIIQLDDDDLEECLTGEPRPRIDERNDYLLVVAYGVIIPQGTIELESRKLAMFRGDRFLVTIHKSPSRAIASLRRRCEKNAGAVLSRGVDQMLYRIIDGMVDRYLDLLDQYEHELDECEERSYDPTSDGELIQDTARIRRHLIEIRRLVGGQRGLLEPLAEGDFDDISEKLGKRFRTVRSHLLHANDRVVGLQERLGAVVQNYNTTIATRTNDIVRTLTVLTAVMMPMTLIAGVYGMNLPVWPSSDSPNSYWAVVGSMGAVGVIMLAVFRRLKWI
ncbi:MAG: magnesium transporter CorA family protein [Planctomycetota bacterium]